MRFLRLRLFVTWAGASLAAAAASGQGADDCATAHSLAGPGLFPFDTTGATESAPAWPCVTESRDVWFRWVAPDSGSFRFTTCAGTSFDSAIEVLAGECGSLVSLGCNDDACGQQSELLVEGVTVGQEYLVRVGGSAGATGPGLLGVFPASQPRVDNERLVTSAGSGSAGADVSERESCVLGYPCNAFDQDDRVIDDFTVPLEPNATGWEVRQVRVYAFGCEEEGASPTPVPVSSITSMSLAIWDGVPHAAGSNRIFGDQTTNVLSGTGWTGAYRVPGAMAHDETSWPIFFADAEIAVFLPEDRTYYLEWGLDDASVERGDTDPLGSCSNLPATPPNRDDAAGNDNALHVVRGTLPRPADPRLFGCVSDSPDDLPFQVWAVPSISVIEPGCFAQPNSSGARARTILGGSGVAGQPVEARVHGGPAGEFGYFFGGANSGLHVVPPGSVGIICIAAPQYRYNDSQRTHLFQFDPYGVSQALGVGGAVILETDGSYGPVVAAGETFRFQAWYRDGGTSNFTDSRAVTFASP
ncbi:MAG: hypothetical protein GY711_13775 [bacterium]|nr:hypothetical protein [bacterium]